MIKHILVILTVKAQRNDCIDQHNIKSCGAHGACISISQNISTCLCDSGYKYVHQEGGENLCDTKVDTCQESAAAGITLCYHQSTCEPIDVTPYYQCKCNLPYSGPNCKSFQDPCVLDKGGEACFNGGECQFHPYGSGEGANKVYYVCLCKPGFSGQNCETVISYGMGGSGAPLGKGVVVGLWVVWIILTLLWCYYFITMCNEYCLKRFSPLSLLKRKTG